MPIEHLQLWISQYGYGAIVVLLMFGIVGLPVPDETLLTLVGYLIFKGTLHPVLSYLSAFAGTTCGISVSFGIGRFGGARLLRRYGVRFGILPERIERVHRWFELRGKWVIALGYFVPGVRHVVAIVAASSGMAFGHFLMFACSGAAFWTLTFLSAGYLLGREWERFPGIMRIGALAVVAAGLLAYGLYGLAHRRTKGS